MTARRVIRVPDYRQPGIVRLREIELPPTGIDAFAEAAAALPTLVARIDALAQRLGVPPARPRPPRPPGQ